MVKMVTIPGTNYQPAPSPPPGYHWSGGTIQNILVPNTPTPSPAISGGTTIQVGNVSLPVSEKFAQQGAEGGYVRPSATGGYITTGKGYDPTTNTGPSPTYPNQQAYISEGSSASGNFIMTQTESGQKFYMPVSSGIRSQIDVYSQRQEMERQKQSNIESRMGEVRSNVEENWAGHPVLSAGLALASPILKLNEFTRDVIDISFGVKPNLPLGEWAKEWAKEQQVLSSQQAVYESEFGRGGLSRELIASTALNVGEFSLAALGRAIRVPLAKTFGPSYYALSPATKTLIGGTVTSLTGVGITKSLASGATPGETFGPVVTGTAALRGTLGIFNPSGVPKVTVSAGKTFATVYDTPQGVRGVAKGDIRTGTNRPFPKINQEGFVTGDMMADYIPGSFKLKLFIDPKTGYLYQRTVAQRVVSKSALKWGGGKEIGFEGKTPRKQIDVIEEVIIKDVRMGKVNPNSPSITRLGIGPVTDFVSVGKVVGRSPKNARLQVSLGKAQEIGQPVELGIKTDAGVQPMPEPFGIKLNRYTQVSVSRSGEMPKVSIPKSAGKTFDAGRSVSYLEVLRPGRPSDKGFKVERFEPKVGGGTKSSLDTLGSKLSESEKAIGPDTKQIEKGFTSLQSKSSSGRTTGLGITGGIIGLGASRSTTQSQAEFTTGTFRSMQATQPTEESIKKTNVGTIAGYVPGSDEIGGGSGQTVIDEQIISDEVIQDLVPTGGDDIIFNGTGFAPRITPLKPEIPIMGGGGVTGWQPQKQTKRKVTLPKGRFRTRIWPIEPNVMKVKSWLPKKLKGWR